MGLVLPSPAILPPPAMARLAFPICRKAALPSASNFPSRKEISLMYKTAPFLAALLLLSAPIVQAAVIPMTPQQIQRLGIRTAEVQPAVMQPAISVLGRVT